MELSKLDQKLIKELMNDSRQSYHQLAKKLKVSAATAMNHIKSLEKEGIIKKYSTIVDYDKLGYDIHILIDLRISKGKLFMVEKKIASHPRVLAVYDNTGQFDATIIARFKTRLTLDKFLKNIQSFDFVERTETKMILNTIREDNLSL